MEEKMKEIRVILWGLGAMGGGMAKLVAEKSGMKIVGALKRRENGVGKDLGDFLELGKKLDVIISNTPEEVIQKGVADVVVHATGSFTKEVFPELEMCMKAGMNVVTIAEEMAYPAAQEPELAEKLDVIARENGVSILGTGVNPGFVLDLLILTLTGGCLNVERIEASRINDLSPFGPTVMRTQGVGTTPDEFAKGIESGEIVGHIGFAESIGMIAKALGWELDEVKQTREAIISNTHRETPYVKVEPGMVAGCRHIGIGLKDGKELIQLIHPQQIRPEKEEIQTGDYIKIFGNPTIDMAIKPEIPGGLGTIAMAVNSIPLVVQAKPGLKTMLDIPVPVALMGKELELRG